MRKSVFFLLSLYFLGLLCLAGKVNAQTPTWLWAKAAGNNGYDYAMSVTADSAGNSYVTGYYNTSISFDPTHTLTSTGSTDLYIVKYDPSGNVLWASTAVGSDVDISSAVAVDDLGNVYLAGYFKSPTLTFGTTTLVNSGGFIYDLFVAKYDPDGNALWAKSAGGTGDDRAYGIAVDEAGNSFITGYFLSPTITLGPSILTNTGFSDIYIAKYAPDGTALWGRSPVGPGWEYSYSVAADHLGHVFLAGRLNGNTLTFGTIVLTKVANHDVIVAKYTTDGEVVWAKNAGTNGDNVANAVTADIYGNCYAAGRFGGNNIIFGLVTLPNAGSGDVFLVKYDLAGNVLWAKSAGGVADDQAMSVTTDKSGYSYAAGFFKSTSVSFGTYPLTNNGSGTADLFVAEYNPDGNVEWAVSAGGTGDEVANSVAVDGSRNFFASGYIGSPTVVFGNDTVYSNGTTDMFIAKSDNTPVGINDVNKKGHVAVFPNPVRDYLTITSQDPGIIEIIDIQGKICRTIRLDSDETKIDLSNLSHGMYLIKLVTGTGVFTQKFLKE